MKYSLALIIILPAAGLAVANPAAPINGAVTGVGATMTMP